METFDDVKRTRDSPIDFPTYEDYLDSFIGPNEHEYLEDEDLARQLIELGYQRGSEALKRDEFEAKKKEAEESKKQDNSRKQKSLCSSFENCGRTNFDGHAFLNALAEREEKVRNGKLTSIIFLRMYHPRTKHEISGYIDYAHRLKQEDFVPYFRGDKKLMPRQSDLSYYNWATQTSTSNPTPNFQVEANNERGLMFKNKRDRKIINVDPKAESGDNTTRTVIRVSQENYIQAVIYDHQTRRKS